MKNYVAFYKSWYFTRQLMDQAFMGPLIAKIVSNTATDEEVARAHMASLPKDLPPAVRTATVAHIARAYGAPVGEPAPSARNPEAGFAVSKFLFLLAAIAAFVLLTMHRSVPQWQKQNPFNASAPGAPPTAKARPGSPFDKVVNGPRAFILPMPPTPPPAPPVFAGVDEGLAAFEQRTGSFAATSVIAGRGNCSFGLVLEQDQPGSNTFHAFTKLGCAPLWQLQMNRPRQEVMKEMLAGMSPKSSKLAGTLVKNTLELKTEDTIDASSDGCVMKSLTLSTWAGGALSAKWDDSPCKGGEMILARAKR
jgi:hypothetical protein